MKPLLILFGLCLLVLVVGALQCDSNPPGAGFALQLKDPALLGEFWDVTTGRVTIRQVEESGIVDLVAVLDAQEAVKKPDGFADQVFLLQMETAPVTSVTHVLDQARTYYDKHGNVLVVALDKPFVLHLRLSEEATMTTEALLKEIGWQSGSVLTTERYDGYGLSRTIPANHTIPIEKSAAKAGERTVFEVYQSCKRQPVGKGGSRLPDQCNIGDTTYECSSGGDGATSCSISGSGGSCSVNCSGGKDACCDSGLTQCKCCHANP
jgi:hypothetical protein